MTAKQIATKLAKANISTANLEIRKNSVEVFVPSPHGQYADSDKSRKLAKKICKALGFSGFSCAHGGWCLSPEPLALGNWNDTSSKWHY